MGTYKLDKVVELRAGLTTREIRLSLKTPSETISLNFNQ